MSGSSEERGWFEARRHRGAALARLLHARYGRLFWALHSVWALLSGVAVLVLAHNRYGFVRWAVLFIGLTWAATLFFSRFAVGEASQAMRFTRAVVSYLTRVMYQETLFFLIPFYFYSTTFPSWNSTYFIVLAGFAVLSCFDLLFDRLLRQNAAFSICFFGFVSFSALQFFLPLLLRVRIDRGATVAAAIAFTAAALLAVVSQSADDWKRRAATAGTLAVLFATVEIFRPLLPPVPLRLTRVRFSGAVDIHLNAKVGFDRNVPISDLGHGRLYAVATIFSPARIPATLQMRFIHDGRIVRGSRNVSVITRPHGFRIWDTLHAPAGGFTPGAYRLEVRTSDGQLVGERKFLLVAR